MRAWIVAGVLLGCGPIAGALHAEVAPVRLSKPEVRSALVAVVTAQVEAFRANDWAKAYAQASLSFQSQVSLQRFVALITNNYPVVATNTRADYGLPSDNGRVGIVPVRVFSKKTSVALNWVLVKEGEVWRITGVVPQNTSGGA